MNKYLVLLSTIVFISSCKKEEVPVTYEDYNSIPLSLKEAIIADSFTDNQNGWHWIDTSNLFDPETHPYVNQVQPGEGLLMTSNTSLGELSLTYDSISIMEDFELEVEVKFIEKKPNSDLNGDIGQFYMSWGFEDFNDLVNYFCLINFPDEQKVDYYTNGITGIGQEYAFVNANDFNKFTIRKVGTELYYYVNENFIGRYPVHSITGNKIGLRTSAHSVYLVKDFSLSKLRIYRYN